jgi:hypothetical protein
MEKTMVQRDTLGMKALLIGMQDGPSVPDGWDAVLNLSQSAVEALVRSNWDGAPGTVENRSLLWVGPADVDGQHDLITVKTDLPLPAVGLNVAGQAVEVGFAIDCGTMLVARAPAELVSRLAEAGSLGASEEIAWSAPIVITPENPLQLGGTIPVAVETAGDRRSFSIALNLADADLALSGRGAEDFSAQAVNQGLESWLAGHKLSGQIGKLELRDEDEAAILTPSVVMTRMAASLNGGPVLQILLAASPGAAAPASVAPVLHPDGQDFSLMVSSRATMTMIANSYNTGTGDIKLVSVPPADEQVHWIARVHEAMIFRGTFSNPEGGEVYATDYASQYMCFGGSTDQGLKLFTYIDPRSTVKLELDLAAHYPVGISGAGTDQVVGLQEGAQSVTGDGFYEGIVRPQLEKFLTGEIRSDMTRVRLTEISDLVLRDLTLSGHALKFDVAGLPGELLIAGSLIPDAEACASQEGNENGR